MAKGVNVRGAGLLAVGLVLVVSGCGTDDEPASGKSSSTAPTRALVVWADQMCETTALLKKTKANSASQLERIENPPDDDFFDLDSDAENYLNDTSTSVDGLATSLNKVRPAGIAAADRFRKDLADNLAKISPQVVKLSDFMTIVDLSAKAKKANARRVGLLVESLKAPQPDLPTLVKKDPKLALAYHLAPRCAPPPKPAPPRPPASPKPSPKAPPKVLPKAKDGTNLSACTDGTCEVLISKPVDVLANGMKLHISVKDLRVTVSTDYPSGGSGESSFSAGGGTGFGTPDGREVNIKGVAVNKDGAVLKFTA